MRLVLVLAVLALAPGARADDVEPPPRDCPAGTRGRSSHSGPHCEVVACETPCPAGLSCVEHGYCIERVACGHIRDEGDCFVDHVVGDCDAGRACTRGTCTSHRVCLAGAPTPSGPTTASPTASPTTASPTASPTTASPTAASEPAVGCAACPGRPLAGALAALAFLLVASRRALRAPS